MINDEFLNSPEYLSLYDKPIQELELSEETTDLLLKESMISVGDCLDFFLTGKQGDALILISRDAVQIMNGEVLTKLKETGYWAIIDDNST